MADRTTKVRLVAEVQQYLAGMEKARKATSEMAADSKEKLAQQREAFELLGGAALAVGAIAAAGAALAVKKYADFDQAMSNVKAATQETASNMHLLREAAIEAGGETVFSAEEAANAIEELGKAGLSTEQILGGGLKGALDLAAAGQLDVARAAEITAITLKQFDLAGGRATDVADLLAAGAGKAAGDVEDLAQALNQSALVAKQTGLSVEETTGTLAAFASAGLLGSDAGTSLKTALQRLTPQSNEAKKEMERLGISAYDAQGQFIGISKFAGVLEEGLGDLTDEQRNASMAIIFGSDAVRAASVLYDQGAAGIQRWIDQTDDSGYAAQVAADRLDNLAGDIEKLGGAFDSALIKSGTAANDSLRTLVQGATFLVDAIGDMPGPILNTSLVIGGLGAATVLTGGAFLVGVPKVAAFKAALLAMEVSGKSAIRTIGGIGGALGVATLAIGYFIGRQANLTQTTQELTDSLDSTTGALTDYSRELVTKKLAEADAFRAAKEAGISQKELTDAVLEGGDALEEVQSKITGNNNFVNFFTGVGVRAGMAQDAIKDLATSVDDSQSAWFDALYATEETERGLGDVSAAATDAGGKITDLASQIRDFGSAQLDVNSAQRGFEQAVDAMTASLEANGTTMDITTEAGRQNQAALDEIASSASELAASLFEQTGSQDLANEALARGREAYLKAAAAAGIAEDDAAAYADVLFATPTQISTAVEVTGINNAQLALDSFIRTNDGRTVRIRADVANTNGISIARENGGIEEYANGGIREGIYQGRPGGIIKFAEPSTGWEAFISGKPGQERRNQSLWVEAGNRLGMFGGASSGPSVPPTIYVQNPFTGEYLLAKVDSRAGALVAGSQQAGRLTIDNGKKGIR